MARYRMRPVEKEAWPIQDVFEATRRNIDLRVLKAFESGVLQFKNGWLEVVTAEGTMRASLSDYLVLGLQGEWYPVMQTVFEKSYEKISD